MSQQNDASVWQVVFTRKKVRPRRRTACDHYNSEAGNIDDDVGDHFIADSATNVVTNAVGWSSLAADSRNRTGGSTRRTCRTGNTLRRRDDGGDLFNFDLESDRRCEQVGDNAWRVPVTQLDLHFSPLAQQYMDVNSAHRMRRILEGHCTSQRARNSICTGFPVVITDFKLPVLRWKTGSPTQLCRLLPPSHHFLLTAKQHWGNRFSSVGRNLYCDYDGKRPVSLSWSQRLLDGSYEDVCFRTRLNINPAIVYRLVFESCADLQHCTADTAAARQKRCRLHAVERVGQFQEALLPRGVCPLAIADCRTSSMHFGDWHCWHGSKRSQPFIQHNGVYDWNERRMLPTGSKRLWDNYPSHWRPATDNVNKEFFIVDLGATPPPITHLSIMGAVPPLRTEWVTEEHCLKDGGSRRHCITVLPWSYESNARGWTAEQDGQWVTSFDLFARSAGRSWGRIGAGYAGNVDPFRELLHAVENDFSGWQPRYLKIVPTAYHNHIAMRIALFTHQRFVSRAKQQQQVEQSHITYTLQQNLPTARSGRYDVTVRDGSSHRFMRDRNNRRTAAAKRDVAQHIANEVRMFREHRPAYMRFHFTPHRNLGDLKHEQGNYAPNVRQHRLEQRRRRRRIRKRGCDFLHVGDSGADDKPGAHGRAL